MSVTLSDMGFDFLLSWLILAISFLAAAKFVPGIKVEKFTDAVLVAALYGVLNLFLGWLIFLLISVVTFGIGFVLAFVTHWIVMAIVLKITDSLTDRLTVDGFGAALKGAFIIALVSSLGQLFVS